MSKKAVFWLNDPAVLLNKDKMMELWPVPGTSLARKLNAMTRLVILLGLLGQLITGSDKIIITAIATLVVIVMVYKTKTGNKNRQQIREKGKREGFLNPQHYKALAGEFTKPTPQNPFMNVMLPDRKYNVDKKRAAPAFNPEVEKEIEEAAGNVGPDPRLFRDLGDNLSFEQSMRQFYPTANTTIPNDQGAFAQFLYGNMPSCRDGDGLACEKKNYRWINY